MIFRKPIPAENLVTLEDIIEDRRFSQITNVRSANDVLYDFISATTPTNSFFDRMAAFIRGETKLGRGFGVALDVFTVFLPPARSAREVLSIIVNRKKDPPMKRAIKRAFTKDGGSFTAIRDIDGDFDLTSLGALALRAAVVLGIFWAATRMGLDPAAVLEYIFE